MRHFRKTEHAPFFELDQLEASEIELEKNGTGMNKMVATRQTHQSTLACQKGCNHISTPNHSLLRAGSGFPLPRNYVWVYFS